MLITRRILPNSINSALKKCLQHTGSMTQYLSTQFNSPLRVAQRAEYRVPASLALQVHFNLRRHSMLWQRDVILSIKDSPVMFARSDMPYDKAKPMIEKLGDQPLGTWLFSRPDLQRSHFRYSHIPAKTLYQYELFHSFSHFDPDTFIWTRQSDFFFDDTQLQLTEFFLPSLTELLCKTNPH